MDRVPVGQNRGSNHLAALVFLHPGLGEWRSASFQGECESLLGVRHGECHVLDAIAVRRLVGDDGGVGGEAGGHHESDAALLEYVRTSIPDAVFGPRVGDDVEAERRPVVVGRLSGVPDVELDSVVSQDGHEV